MTVRDFLFPRPKTGPEPPERIAFRYPDPIPVLRGWSQVEDLAKSLADIQLASCKATFANKVRQASEEQTRLCAELMRVPCEYCKTRRGFQNGRCLACGGPEP